MNRTVVVKCLKVFDVMINCYENSSSTSHEVHILVKIEQTELSRGVPIWFNHFPHVYFH